MKERKVFPSFFFPNSSPNRRRENLSERDFKTWAKSRGERAVGSIYSPGDPD